MKNIMKQSKSKNGLNLKKVNYQLQQLKDYSYHTAAVKQVIKDLVEEKEECQIEYARTVYIVEDIKYIQHKIHTIQTRIEEELKKINIKHQLNLENQKYTFTICNGYNRSYNR